MKIYTAPLSVNLQFIYLQNNHYYHKTIKKFAFRIYKEIEMADCIKSTSIQIP